MDGGAVHLVAELRPAILVVDVSMPGISGVELTRAPNDSGTGPGIGLTLAKALMERQGARISVHSDGRGRAPSSREADRL